MDVSTIRPHWMAAVEGSPGQRKQTGVKLLYKQHTDRLQQDSQTLEGKSSLNFHHRGPCFVQPWDDCTSNCL